VHLPRRAESVVEYQSRFDGSGRFSLTC
jgi:hypothetical protein